MECIYNFLTINFVFSYTVTAQRTPTISYISQEQIKDIGGVVELQCSVQYGQDYPVLWMKINGPDQVPISSQTTLILRDSRFSLRYDTTSSTYALQIKDIQETDAGYYQCQVVISINNKISAQVELQVRRPPFISDNSTRSEVVVEGSEVKLECYAGGFPPPKISWRRENNAILPTGGSIYRWVSLNDYSSDHFAIFFLSIESSIINTLVIVMFNVWNALQVDAIETEWTIVLKNKIRFVLLAWRACIQKKIF